MALAQTTTFGDYILWIETATPGTYELVCGMTQLDVDRTNTFEEVEVPYCDPTELNNPSAIEISPKAQSVSISTTGVMSEQSRTKMWEWWKSGAKKSFRIERRGAATGTLQYESGSAYLEKYRNETQKGQKVTADLSIKVDGTTTPTFAP